MRHADDHDEYKEGHEAQPSQALEVTLQHVVFGHVQNPLNMN